MILVVFSHIYSANREVFSGFSLASSYNYSFHMPLFFFISGYCQYLSSSSSTTDLRYFVKRSKKTAFHLLTCYFLWSGIYYLVRFWDTPKLSVEWFCSIFTFRGRAPLWFLPALMLAEMMLFFFQFITKNRSRYLAVFVAFSALLTILCGAWMGVLYPASLRPSGSSPIGELLRFYLCITVFRCLPCFFFVGMGYLLAPLLRRCASLKAYAALLLSVSIISFGYAVQYITHNPVNLHLFKLGTPLVFFVTGLAGSIGFFLLFQALGRWLPFPVLRLLGVNSLGIMVLHYSPLKTMKWAFQLSSLVASASPLLLMLATLFLTLLFSLVGSLLIKKRLYL